MGERVRGPLPGQGAQHQGRRHPGDQGQRHPEAPPAIRGDAGADLLQDGAQGEGRRHGQPWRWAPSRGGLGHRLGSPRVVALHLPGCHLAPTTRRGRSAGTACVHPRRRPPGPRPVPRSRRARRHASPCRCPLPGHPADADPTADLTGSAHRLQDGAGRSRWCVRGRPRGSSSGSPCRACAVGTWPAGAVHRARHATRGSGPHVRAGDRRRRQPALPRPSASAPCCR